MPYNLSQGGNAMAIAEQEYATAGEIKFTAFTSCIGIISRDKTKITGIHLVIIGKDKTPFNDNVIPEIVRILGSYDQVWVIGSTGIWENPANGVSAAYEKLIKALKNPSIYPLADGTYGAKLDEDGDLELTY
ncbi:MAG: hypothetical protein ACPGJS_10695 [Flammeovirgaceae bacterium]